MSVEDPKTWPQYGTIDPEFSALLQQIGPQNLPSLSGASDVPTLRAQMFELMAQAAAAAPPPDYSGVLKSDIQIPVRDGEKIRGVLYKPDGGERGPLAVLYHGGGFCVGIPEMEEPFALQLVREFGSSVVSVDYRMAPEKVFPTAQDDSWDATKWSAENAASLGADPTKGFIVGGTSAGGIIACVVSHIARDEKLNPPLTAVWLNIPQVVGKSVLPEKYKDIVKAPAQNKDAPILDQAAIDFFMANYKPDDSDPKASPLLWPGGHANLPPHIIQAAGLDPLRDDSLIYHDELKKVGVPVETFVYPGVPHGFDGMFAMLGLAAKFRDDRTAWLNKYYKK